MLKKINPDTLGKPRGYSNGVLVPANARMLFISGQIGWNSNQEIVSTDFAGQFDQALANVISVVEAAGGSAEGISRITMYVTDKQEYISSTGRLRELWRSRMGDHYPAMTLVEVKGLLGDLAKVELEAIAVIGGSA
jgi:enamine deaminase RidA (YjgF/YER057c/UK114 family)